MKKRAWVRVLSWMLVFVMLIGDVMPAYATETGEGTTVVEGTSTEADGEQSGEAESGEQAGEIGDDTSSDSSEEQPGETETEGLEKEDDTTGTPSEGTEGDGALTDGTEEEDRLTDGTTENSASQDDLENDIAEDVLAPKENDATGDEDVSSGDLDYQIETTEEVVTAATGDSATDPITFEFENDVTYAELYNQLKKAYQYSATNWKDKSSNSYRFGKNKESLEEVQQNQAGLASVEDNKSYYGASYYYNEGFLGIGAANEFKKGGWFKTNIYYNITVNFLSASDEIDVSNFTYSYNGNALLSGKYIKVYKYEGERTITIPVVEGAVPTITFNAGTYGVPVPNGDVYTFSFTPNATSDLVITYSPIEKESIALKTNRIDYGFISYAVGDKAEENTQGTKIKNLEGETGETVKLTANPLTDCNFFRWKKIDENGMVSYISESELNVQIKNNVIYEAQFYHETEDEFVLRKAGTEECYLNSELPSTINNAVADSGEKYVLIGDATLSENISIPSGVTFLLPYQPDAWTIGPDGADYSNSHVANEGENDSTVTNTLVGPNDETYKNVELTVYGATIDVQKNAKLITGGWIGSKNSGLSGQTCKWHSDIVMDSESQMNVYGIVSSCGYITGGTINVKSGGSLYAPLIICDYQGGSNTRDLYNKGISPFNQYSMLNVQSNMNIDYGGSLYGYADLYTGDNALASAKHNRTELTLIGSSNALITVSNGATVEIVYKKDSVAKGFEKIGQTSITVNGGATFETMTLKLKVIVDLELNTSSVVFPVPYNYSLELKNGEYVVDTSYKILPGAKVHVHEGANLVVESQKTLQVYDGIKLPKIAAPQYPNGANLINAENGAKTYEEIGRLIVDGTLTIEDSGTFAGIVETTGNTGNIIVKNATLTSTLKEGTDGGTTKASTARIWNRKNNSLTVLEKNTNYYAENNSEKHVLSDSNFTYQSGYDPTLEGVWIVPEITFKCECDTHKTDYPTYTADYKATISYPACTKEGYTLAYWKDANGNKFTSTTMPKAIVELYPHWEPINYTVTLKSSENGPELEGLSDPWKDEDGDGIYVQTYTLEDTNPTIILPIPTATGYTFKGWVINESDDPVKDVTIDKSSLAEPTYTAKWEINKHNVILHSNGSEWILSDDLVENQDGIVSISNVEYASDVNISGVSREGYDLTWKTESGADAPTSMPDADLYLYAHWMPKKYDVTFDANGGTFGENSSLVKEIEYDSNLYEQLPADNELTAPNGYEFAGWYDSKQGGVKVNEGSVYKNDRPKTYYAHWNAITYSISLNANGGSIEADGWTDTASNGIYVGGTFTVEEASEILPEPTKAGYTFAGWLENDNLEKTEDGWRVKEGSFGDQTYTASWQGLPVEVTLSVPSDVTLETGKITFTYGGKYGDELPATVERTGYTFKGWYTKENGAGEKITKDTDIISYSGHTLYAHWEVIKYTVTFMDGEKLLGTQEIAFATILNNEAINSEISVEKITGYSFSGWFDAEEGGNQYFSVDCEATMPAQALVLYAQRTIKKNSITLKLSGGLHDGNTEDIILEDVAYGTKIELPTVTKVGYHAPVWKTAAGNEVPELMPEYGITLVAHWDSPIEYKVVLNTEGGSFEEKGWTATENSYYRVFNIESAEFTLPVDVKKVGHTFGGWNYDGETKVTVVEPETVIPTLAGDAVTLEYIADWLVNDYTITFVNTGDSTISPITAPYDSDIENPVDPERAGYTFAGWNPAIPSKMPVDGMNVSATWTKNLYKINFVVDGEVKGTLENVEFTTVLDDKINLPTIDIDKTGYTFIGWYIEDDVECFTPETTVTMPVDGISVTAKYVSNAYKIIFDGNTADGGIAPSEISTTYDANVTIPACSCTKTGYHFVGWNTLSDGTGIAISIGTTETAPNLVTGVAGDDVVTLYAQWERNNYTVKFHANNDTEDSVEQAFVYDKEVKLLQNGFAYEGYTFVGWAETKDATVAKYTEIKEEDGTITTATVNNLTAENAGIYQLYAVWTPNEYTISYDLNYVGAPTVAEKTTAVFDAKYPTLYKPNRTGYIFTGWYTETENGTRVIAGSTLYKNSADTTLYACWEAVTYEITLNHGYEIDGVEKTDTITVTFDQPYSYGTGNSNGLKNLERTGYAFKGWFTEEEGVGNQIQPESVISNTNVPSILYAFWDATDYTIKYKNTEDIQNTLINGYNATELPLTLKNPSRTGYKFTGWSVAGAEGLQQTYTIPEGTTGALEFTANWEIVNYTITYNCNQGTMPSEYVTNYTIVEDHAIELPIPERVGYTFTGWKEVGTNRVIKELTVGTYGDKELEEVWEANTYKVTLNANGGKVGGLDTKEITVTYDGTYQALETPSRIGYTFQGWFTAPESGVLVEASDIVKVTANQELFAQWAPITYTVTFDANGVAGVENIPTEQRNCVYDKEYSLPETDPSCDGYTFLGWALQKNATEYLDNISNLSATTKVVTLYAIWSVNNYEIKYEGIDVEGVTNGEELAGNPNDYTVESESTTIINPDRTGYTFSGWTVKTEEGTTDTPSTETTVGGGSTGSVTYVANWTANKYSVTLNAGAGSMNDNQTMEIKVTFDDTYGELPTPIRTGYEFAGWFYEEQVVTRARTISTEVTSETTVKVAGDDTLYAHWNPITYTVAFDSGVEGETITGLPDTIQCTYDQISSIPAEIPSRAGYTFKGWSETVNGSVALTEIYNLVNTAQNEPVVLYAIWDANDYIISFDSDGGTTVPALKADYKETVNEPTKPTKTGYTFVGWFEGETEYFADGTMVMPLDGITLTAKWTINTYKVFFRDDDGTTPLGETSFEYASAVTAIADPVKDGYQFSNWSPALPEAMPADDVVVKAVWTPNKYTITFNSNGGSAVDSIEADYKETVNAPTKPTKAGYTFAGWFEGETEYFADGTMTIPLNGITVTAKWNPIEYTIAFAGNGADGGVKPDNISAIYDESVEIPECSFTKTGYHFTGWDTSINGSGVTYQPGTLDDKNLTTVAGKNVVLYAQWEANQYTVKYDANGGGDPEVTTQIMTYDAWETLSTQRLSREGYAFAGWKLSPDAEEYYAPGEAVMNLAESGEVVLYANWVIQSYKVTLRLWDDQAGSTVTYEFISDENWTATITNGRYQAAYEAEYDTVIPEPPVPAKTGYDFEGWYTSTDFSEETAVVFDENAKIPGRNITLYANWTLKDCEIIFGNVDECTFVPEKIEGKYGSLITEPEKPVRTGYTFKGWYTDAACSDGKRFAFSDATKMPESMILYAKWEINSYTVSYINTGENTYESITVVYNEEVAKPDFVPTYKGYEFKYWSLEMNGEEVVFPVTMPADDLKLYAVYDSYLDWIKATDITKDEEFQLAREYFQKLNAAQIEEYKQTAHWEAFSSKIREVSVISLRQSVIDAQSVTNDILSKVETTETQGDETIKKVIDLAEMKVFDENLSANPPKIEGMIKEDQYAAINMLNVEFMTALFDHDEIVSIVADNDTEPDTSLKEHVLTGNTIASSGTILSDQFNIMLIIAWAALDPDSSQKDFMNYLQSQMTTLKLEALDGKSLYITAKAESPEGVPYEATYALEFYSETHDLIYDFDGGNATEYQKTAKYEETVTLVTPVKRGHTFEGWTSNDVTLADESFVMGKTDVNLKANWSLDAYQITLDLGDGTLIEAVQSNWSDNAKGYDALTESIVLPGENQMIAPKGYAFGGWYVEGAENAQMNVVLNPSDTAFELKDITYKTKWIPIEYTLKFVIADKVDTVKFTVETTNIELPVPERYGYTFEGWDDELTYPMPANDVTLTAQWKAKEIPVTLYLNDGTDAYETAKVVFAGNFGILPTPEREGYGFDGWFTEVSGGKKYDGTVNVTSEETVELYAHWTAGSYTINYAGMEGAVNHADNPNNYVVDTEVELKAPTKTGYTFLGWTGNCVEERAGKYYIVSGIIGTQTVTANWLINQYTITFDSNGGNTVEAIEADYLDKVNAPEVPSREGYTFAGWFAGDVQYFVNGTSVTMPLDGLNLKAKWNINSHSITFLRADGSTLDVATYNYAQVIEAKTADEVDGYTFIGWFDADGIRYFATETGEEKVETMPDHDLIVTAKYRINQYTFSFNTGCDVSIADITKDYASVLNAPEKPVKTGYTFIGWFDADGEEYFAKDADGIAKSETVPAKDVALTAKWAVNKYDLVFMNGEQEHAKITEDYGTVVSEPAAPTKVGYIFTGWDQEVPVSMPAENKVFNAQWNAIHYTVAFNSNGAGNITLPENMTELAYDTSYAIPEFIPERIGYTFKGWKTDALAEETIDEIYNLTANNEQTVTLYASWEAKTYTVTFDANGGTVEPSSKEVTYDDVYGELPVPEWEGYTFSGWSDGTTIYTESTVVKITEDQTLTAQWTEKGDTPYKVVHHLQNLADDEYTKDKEVDYTGKTNGTANAAGEDYTGFVLNTEKSTMSGTITGDGELVLNLYYDRMKYKVTWNVADTSVEEFYKYEAMPEYKGEKDFTDDHGIHTFTAWDKKIEKAETDVVYTALYEVDYEASIGEVTYITLEKAISKAKSGETVRLDKDITLSEDLTVPAGVNLLLPCIDDDYGYNLVDKGRLKFNHDGTSTAGGTGVGPYAKLYRTLTIPKGVILNVKGNVLVNSVSGRPVGGTADMDITGGYAVIELNGDIIVKNGGNLDCFGYVRGAGKVTAENGGSVGDLFIVRHWRGGTQAFAMYQSIMNYGTKDDPINRQVYPMNEYDCHNIETDVIVKYGASYDGLVKMCANAGDGNAYYYTRFPQVNVSNGMIRLVSEDGYVVRTYDKEEGKDIYTIYGGAKFAESSLNIAGVSLTTKDFLYPMDGDYWFELYDGIYSFVNDFKFLPGGSMVVHSGSTLKIEDDVFVAFYDEFNDKPNTGNTQYPVRDKMILKIEEGAKFINGGTFGGSIVTESPDILIGDYPKWGITTMEANGYCGSPATVNIVHDLFITRKGYDWRYGDPALGEEKDSIIWIGADYTELDAAISTIPDDLKIYSDETVKPLKTVTGQIVYGLGKDKQPLVDDWTKAILNGVENLKLRVVKVVFNANGGTCKQDSMNVTYGDAYGKLPEAEYYGYTFLGWFDADNMLITAENVMKKTVNQITLTAKWEEIPADYSKVNEAIAAIPQDMTGYTKESVKEVYDAQNAVDMTLGLAQQKKVDAMADAILDAIERLERVQIVVSFDANGGEEVEETFTLRYGDIYPYDELPTPNREGFEFVAWYTAKEGGSEIKANTKVTSVTDVVLYAKWLDSSSNEPADYSPIEAAKQKIPADLRPYTTASVNKLNEALDAVVPNLMANRQDDINAWAAAIEKAVEELTFKTITVYFDPVGGECTVKSIQVTYGTECESLPTANKEYSKFLGWYTAKEGGVKVEASELSSKLENVTLYARYELLPADYSRLEEISAKIPADLRCYSDESVAVLNAVLAQIERGYTADKQSVVDRWANELEAACDGLSYRMMTMTYDAQGGKVSPKSTVVQYNSTIKGLPTPELAYNEFAGWYTEAEGGEKVTEGMVITNLNDFSIYAHWIQLDADYTKVYEALAKVPTEEEWIYYTDESIAELKAAIDAVQYGLNAGYQGQVNNWAGDINFARQKLRTKSVTVTFEYNGGTGNPKRRTIPYGNAYGNLPQPTKEGYKFVGWYTENVGGEKIESTTKVLTIEKYTLYARWDDGKADYTAVQDAIDKIPQDISSGIYTEEAVKAVEDAVAAVVYDLPDTEQHRVDAWADAIENAIEALSYRECEDGFVSQFCPSGRFEDLDLDSWYHLYADYVVENKIMNGTGATTFGPDIVTTRGMVVMILYNMSKEQVTQEAIDKCTFTDVDRNMYYAPAVAWAADKGVVAGFSETEFRPEDTITREQMIVMIRNYARYCGYDVEASGDLAEYSDKDAISSWARESILWARAKGIISGYSETDGTMTIRPQDNAIRIQVATFITLYCRSVN